MTKTMSPLPSIHLATSSPRTRPAASSSTASAPRQRLEGNRIGTAGRWRESPWATSGPACCSMTVRPSPASARGLPDGENTIAFNLGAGVEVLASNGNRIRVNSIFANTGLAIDLGGDGVTPNDPDDSDDGPDGLQNFPVLTHVDSYGGRTYRPRDPDECARFSTSSSTSTASATPDPIGLRAGTDVPGLGDGRDRRQRTRVVRPEPPGRGAASARSSRRPPRRAGSIPPSSRRRSSSRRRHPSSSRSTPPTT